MIVQVRVVANSQRPGVEQFEQGLKVRVKAKPIEGKANEEVVKLVAAHFKVAKSSVRIVSGATSKRKTVEIIE